MGISACKFFFDDLVRAIFQGVELVDNDYFITEENVGMLKLAKEANTILVTNLSL